MDLERGGDRRLLREVGKGRIFVRLMHPRQGPPQHYDIAKKDLSKREKGWYGVAREAGEMGPILMKRKLKKACQQGKDEGGSADWVKEGTKFLRWTAFA